MCFEKTFKVFKYDQIKNHRLFHNFFHEINVKEIKTSTSYLYRSIGIGIQITYTFIH